MKQIFLAGLYYYAVQRRVPAGFTADAMKGAFRHSHAGRICPGP